MPSQRLSYKYFPVGFEKVMNMIFEHLCKTASEITSKKEFLIYDLVMFSSLKSVLCYTKIIVITPRGA